MDRYKFVLLLKNLLKQVSEFVQLIKLFYLMMSFILLDERVTIISLTCYKKKLKKDLVSNINYFRW